MKIGLVRHFKVNQELLDREVGWEEYTEWMKAYDHIDVTATEVDLRDIDWNKCYSSDLSRAVTTAETIYKGEIIKSPLIREVPLHLVKPRDSKVHPFAWSVYAMVNWMNGTDTMAEGVEESRKRVREFLDQLEAESKDSDNILVVCHGMIMMVLEEELIKRGFTGEDIVFANNGELFLYER